MPLYAKYDPTAPPPSKVTGWYNTNARVYPNLPAAGSLLEITPAQWMAREANPDAWAVSGNELVPYTPPAPVLTLAQQAANAATGGITITLTGSMTLAATLFPTDARTQKSVETMAAMARAGVLPTGSTTYPMLDSAGGWHHFTAAQYQAVADTIAAYVSACDLIAAGNPLEATALPAASVSLAV